MRRPQDSSPGWSRRLSLLLCAALWLAGCSARSNQPEELPLPYRQAEDAFRLGDYERAARGYQVYLRSGDAEELVPRAYYKLALSQFRRKQYQECLNTLDELDRAYPKRQWAQALELRGDTEEARGNTISAIRWWEQAWLAADGDHRIILRRRLNEAIGRLDTRGLVGARAVLQTPEIQSLVDARLKGGGGPAPERAAGEKPPAVTGTRAGATPAVPAGTPIEGPPRIACLIPITGPDAAYGQRSLNGIRLALGPQAEHLVVRDSRGLPEVARAALDELIADPTTMAVIGPLKSNVAQTVAARAERAGLPMALLSQREVALGRFVLQPVMTYERQAAELAEYASRGLGLRRIGVLFPNDGYGSSLSQAFRTQFQQRGGTIVGALSYAPGAPEFGVEVLSVQKWLDDGLQAVFIPDYAETAVVLGRALRRMRPDLMLLGSNGWNDPARLAAAAGELDGAVFVDGFFAASGRPATQAFVSAYQQAYQTAPEILEAQAYDVAMLIRRAIERGAHSRQDLLPALERMGTFEGAAGRIRIGPRGLERDLVLLRLSAGAISEIPFTRAGATQAGPQPPREVLGAEH